MEGEGEEGRLDRVNGGGRGGRGEEEDAGGGNKISGDTGRVEGRAGENQEREKKEIRERERER